MVQLKVALVAPAVGSVAHARSLYANTSSRLKSIQPHKLALPTTPESETVVLYVCPATKLSVGELTHSATPSSFLALVASDVHRATASAFVVA